MTDHDPIRAALESMQPATDPTSTERALADLHQRATGARRHQRITRIALGSAAAVLLIATTMALVTLGTDDNSAPVAIQPPDTTTTSTTTTVPVWSVPPTTIPDRLTTTELDSIVGMELRTWFFDEDVDGFWSAGPELLDAVVEALRQGGDPVPMPSVSDIGTIRFERSDGTFLFRQIDIESGWVEPDQRLPEDIAQQIRTEFNDAVASPWEAVDMLDPIRSSYLAVRISDAGFPIRDLDDVAPAFDLAFEANRCCDYERWFIDVFIEGHGPIVEIRDRPGGDDSSRGFDYRISLVSTPDGWTIGGAMSRHLCLRSRSYELSDSPGTWACT